MDQQRDLEKEQLLGDIIFGGGDVLSFLNNTDGQEGENDGSVDQTMEEDGHDHDGSGDQMEGEGHRDDGSDDRTEGEGRRDDGFGDQTESGQVYMYILIN